MKKRERDNYDISKKRYKELCGFCEQYPDWKQELKNYTLIHSPEITGMPKGNHQSRPTEEYALQMERYLANIQLIEDVAKMADPEFWMEIIKSACYEVSATYLIGMDEMPLSKSAFYYRRRKFFYLLDKKKKF
jgi:hypothetical protein